MPPLLSGSAKICVLIRVGGEKGEYMLGAGENIYTANKIYKKSCQIGGMSIHCNDSKLIFKDFDWNTPVEFLFIASADNIDKTKYIEGGLDYNKCSLSTEMVETSGANTNGPAINTSLKYICEYKKGSLDFLDKINASDLTDSSRNRFIIEQVHKINSKQPEIEPLMAILQKQNNLASFVSKFPFNSDKRFLYASYYRCHYESLTGMDVDSIRPFSRNKSLFSDRINLDQATDKQTKRHYDYEFHSIVSGGKAINEKDKAHVNVKDQGALSHASCFSFPPPKDYLNDAAWVQEPEEANELKRVAKLYGKESLYTKWSKLDKNTQFKKIKHWIELDTSTIKQNRFKAL